MPDPGSANPGGHNWPGAGNALGSEPSAYLRQHADNPVYWRPFGDEAFAFAVERDVPVFLSIGYAACHWCHVMAHESFEDQETADYLNAHFVPVKVDREERPDVDSVYMAATQAISGEGGWPMSVFLTPEGLAFHAGTYFPPTPLPGRPSFRNVLEAVHDAWVERRDGVEQNARGLAANMANTQMAAAVRLDGPPELLDPAVLAEAVRLLARSEDPDAGGFGNAPKFPPSAVLEFLIRHAAAPSDTADAARDMAGRALAGMARSALRDQLDGGFARYSVTADWSVPHFEKMLYDNAQLLRVCAHWVRLGGNEVFTAEEGAAVASRCADWMLDSLLLAGGGLASSLDADAVVEGVHHEGATYLWTREALVDALGPGDAQAVASIMNIGAQGTVSALGSPLHPGRSLTHAEAQLWERVRPRLLAARDPRSQPARDDKVVAGWNGIAVAALAEAGAVLDRPDLVQAAEAVARYLVDVHWDSGARQLVRVSHDSQARGIGGLLEDYAFCADGLLALYAVTGHSRWYAAAEDLIHAACTRFTENGYLSDSTGESAQVFNAQGQHPALDPFDNATPSGASAFGGALLSYAAYSGSHDHRVMAGNILGLLPPLATQAPRVAGWLLATAQAALAGPVEAAVAGPESPLRRELHLALLKSPSPGLVIALQPDPDDASPADAAADVPLLLQRAGGPEGEPLVYLCHGMVCERPLGDVPAILARLAAMASGGQSAS
ncbi:thioredoxin domain-containing protein [Paenarthrobacter sp. GOM3]|uniref:thioredoxin domain-containing protein n=1 Tax=Paenarthrobacter sp. GOM3 TaxID=2782567 RepID=UPI002011E0EA|nr:thioredoxin domain-containing protein [Paenarthrobacter sp. GOM3]WOH19921.1 thioredoxin domain-containing protein [Paenarthrobacter sp. GOM3]